MKHLVLGLLMFGATLGAVHGSGRDAPPNIVIIFIDDMGYADIGPFGAKTYNTPHLDRLAREGRRFTSFYVSQAVCSASRTSLLTGCYNVRVGILGALGPASRIGISDDETTLGEIARQQGYATACFGKWHLGHHPQFLPTRHGFDEYYGLAYSNDMWPFHPESGPNWPDLPMFEGESVVNPQVTAEDQTRLTTDYTERAVDFIRRNRDRPFLLYVPHTMVHVPIFVSEKYAGRSGAGRFGDTVQEVDWSVGRITETLRELGLAERTLLIFTSDNGPWLSYGDHAGSAGPLREGKGTTFEGGVRVPCIAWWPGRIPAGTTCPEPAMTIDVLPTIATLIGADLPRLPIDGLDIGPLLWGGPGATNPHEAYFFYWGSALQAVRSGRWKLHFPHDYRTLAGRTGGTNGIPAKYQTARIELSLFDLEKDIGETMDVAGQHPDVVRRLEILAERMRAELGDSARKVQGKAVRDPGRREAN